MTNPETQIFEDKLALIRCLPELNSLRVAGKLTDWTIELQGNVRLSAHRVVFACRLPSLSDALCETPKKDQTVLLKWPKISSEVATPFINYLYTGQLEIREANAVATIRNASDRGVGGDFYCRQTACVQHIKATFEASVASYVITQLPPDAVLSLLRADDLRVEAFMREVRWYQVDVRFRYRMQDYDDRLWNTNVECS
ncbi:unnamed protein product [Dibothriocephalus latus]|uniref:BTB domain-containing protein n=1 Tax=Dibothriocephalus latus TaxID=60516 RepID=A0A3P7P7K3_DIBLA|nr:unnamed protein product [Dibothriocephalus latus]